MPKTLATAASATLLALSVLAAAPAQAGYTFGGHKVVSHCFYKKVKLWDAYYGRYYYDIVLVCPGY